MTRKLVQPFVLQYGRPAVEARRRILRIATDRPATDEVVVRDIMDVSLFLLARPSRGALARRRCGRLPGSLIAYGSVSRAGANRLVPDPGRTGSGLGSTGRRRDG
jgi:hypothetical protein